MIDDFYAKNEARRGGSVLAVLGPGLLLMLIAAAGAGFLRRLESTWPSHPERVLQVAGLAAAAGLVIAVTAYLGLGRGNRSPRRAGLIVLAAIGTSLVAFYLTWVSHYVEFPADILIWSEGDFVNDIVKFRIGYPLYTDPQNSDSFHYPPGSQLCTYALARLCGAPGSIPMYRLVQLCYGLAAAVVAVCCYLRIMQLSGTMRFAQDRGLWGAVALPFFFLIATNSITSPFAHNLHNDALAQLVAVSAYWLLLDYAVTRRRFILALMASIPALGFLVKQSLAIWIPLYGCYLLVFDPERTAVRAAGLVVVAIAALALLLGGCYGLWGEYFWYWIVHEQSTHGVTAIRCFQHLLDAWMYYGAGLFAGLVLLQGAKARRLIGPWVIWLLFLLTVTYTSGIEWMLNHMAPGCLLAGIWFLAALTRLCSVFPGLGTTRLSPIGWARTALGVAVVCLAYAGLGLIWMPVNPLPVDAYRYVDEIEREFAGLPASKVLLDMGTWIPARDLRVSRDQAPGIGSRGSSREKGDFSGILSRLEHRYYEKILVHNLDAPAFWYDDRTWWQQSTGIRRALLENYQEVGRIKAVEGEKRFMLFSFEPVPFVTTRYGFKEITILIPKPLNGPGPR